MSGDVEAMVDRLGRKAEYTDRVFNNHSLGEMYREAAAMLRAQQAEIERLRGLLSEALGDLCEWRRREYDPNDKWPLIDAINAALAGGTNDG